MKKVYESLCEKIIRKLNVLEINLVKLSFVFIGIIIGAAFSRFVINYFIEFVGITVLVITYLFYKIIA